MSVNLSNSNKDQHIKNENGNIMNSKFWNDAPGFHESTTTTSQQQQIISTLPNPVLMFLMQRPEPKAINLNFDMKLKSQKVNIEYLQRAGGFDTVDCLRRNWQEMMKGVILFKSDYHNVLDSNNDENKSLNLNINKPLLKREWQLIW